MDPFNKTYWNLLQTLAWVYSGDRAIVREANDDASDSGTFWQEMRLPDGRKEPVETASRPQHENAALSLIIAAAQAGGAAYATFKEAEDDILAKLQDGRLTAIGVENGKGNPADVPQAFWRFLKFHYDPEPHAGLRDCGSGMAPWYGLGFKREQVLELWPDPLATAVADPAKAKRRRGRTKGSGEYNDSAALKQMDELIKGGEAKSIHQAADMAANKCDGPATRESKIRRLERKYDGPKPQGR